MNYYFLVAGVLLLIFAAGHALWGQKHMIVRVEGAPLPQSVKLLIFFSWNLPTMFLSISAMALMLAASTEVVKAHALAWFIIAVMLGNFFLFVGVSLIKYRQGLKGMMPQFFMLALLVDIIIAGVLNG